MCLAGLVPKSVHAERNARQLGGRWTARLHQGLQEVKELVRGSPSGIRLGLHWLPNGKASIKDVNCVGLPLLPLVNAWLLEALGPRGQDVSWSSLVLWDRSQPHFKLAASGLPQLSGQAVLFAIGPAGSASLRLEGPGVVQPLVDLTTAPAFVPAAAQFSVLASVAVQLVALAFQGVHAGVLLPKTAGRLKALGCPAGKEGGEADPLAQPPSDAVALRQSAIRRAAGSGAKLKAALKARQRPTVTAGFGEPLFVGRGPTRRLLAEGGGLCSPGL